MRKEKIRMKILPRVCLRRWICPGLMICVSLGVFGVGGCGPKIVPKQMPDVYDGVQQTDKDKIQGYLESAGVKGEIKQIQVGEGVWYVDVGAPASKDGKVLPVAPRTY